MPSLIKEIKQILKKMLKMKLLNLIKENYKWKKNLKLKILKIAHLNLK
jgi:hypothetical protein